MTPDHDNLLTLARNAHAAAGDADVARLRMDLELFVHVLQAHVDRESAPFTRLPPAEARLLQRGQVRVSAAARALLAEAALGCSGDTSRCSARSEEVLDLMVLQASDERRAFHRSTPPATLSLPSEAVA